MATAALGLGGIWVNEHRGSSEARRAIVVWRQALAGLDRDHEGLRWRLEALLAAEQAYLDPDIGPMVAAVRELREQDDPGALAEALFLYSHLRLGPGYGRCRQELGEEMLGAAFRSGDEMLVLMALCWRVVGAYLEGEVGAERALAVFRERLELVDCAALRYVADVIEVMRTIRAGRLDQAEVEAEACQAAGSAIGDKDALAYHSAHLLAIRWRQNRDAELLPAIENLVRSPTVADGSYCFVAAQAAVTARVGKLGSDRRALAMLPDGGVKAIPSSSGGLVTLFALVEAAHALGDRDLADDCYHALLPRAGLPVMASIAVASFGPVERCLARAAHVLGRTDQAVAHFERALDECVLLGEVDVERLVRRELDLVRPSSTTRVEVARQGRHRTIAWRVRKAVVRDMVGVRYLAELVRTPGVGVPALELVAITQAGATEMVRAQAVLDHRGISSYKRAVKALEDDIAEAEEWNDDERVARLRAERDAVIEELARTLNLRGTSRNFSNPIERARVSVRKALLRAVDEIEAADAELGPTSARPCAPIMSAPTCLEHGSQPRRSRSR